MDRICLLSTLNGHTGRVWCVAWHPKGRLLASCSEDKSIRLWLEEDGKRWVPAGHKNKAHNRTVRYLTWSPCGKYLASAGFDGIVSIWTLKTLQNGGQELDNLVSLEGHENEVKCLSWSPNGQYLATCGRDKSVWIWEVDEEFDCQCISVLQPHTQDVKCVRWHPSGSLLFSCSYDNTIRIHREDLDDWGTVSTLEGHEGTVWSLDFDAEGDKMVTGSADLSVRLWKRQEPEEWSQVATLTGLHQQPIYHCVWCPLTGLITSVSGDNSFCVLRARAPNPSGGKQTWGIDTWERRDEAHAQDVNGAAWNPSSDFIGLLATCSDDETVKIWRVQSEEEGLD